MKLHLDRSDVQYSITGYGPGHVLINGTRHETGLVILPDALITDWADTFEQLDATHFARLHALHPELVLFGSGVRQRFPAPALYRSLIEAHIGVEIMTTAAACRTYGILAGEGRRVAAALLVEAE